jgi:hypothetical protein
VEDRVEKVPGSIAGEGSSGAVGSVRSWREPEDEESGVGVSEARYGTGPVGLIAVGFSSGFANMGAVEAEARAQLTGDDVLLDVGESVSGGRKDETRHRGMIEDGPGCRADLGEVAGFRALPDCVKRVE